MVHDASGRIARALDAVNLTARAGDAFGTLSKGLRQRVGLRRTLLGNPEILFPHPRDTARRLPTLLRAGLGS